MFTHDHVRYPVIQSGNIVFEDKTVGGHCKGILKIDKESGEPRFKEQLHQNGRYFKHDGQSVESFFLSSCRFTLVQIEKDDRRKSVSSQRDVRGGPCLDMPVMLFGIII